MKQLKTLLTALTLALLPSFSNAQVCNANGNVVIFSNYDGGTLNINVDVNIPNLKIGVVSYEAVAITLSGTYASNVVEVNYSGYNNSPNTNCAPSIATTSITGAGGAVTNIETIPAATYTDPDGYPFIICSYQCATGSNGGCNSPFQIAEYYTTKFGGSLYAHETQYGCWSGTQAISSIGNCCLIPAVAPVADFSVVSDAICAGECIDFTDLSVNSPDTWSWTATGATPATSTDQNPTICFDTPGTYNVELEVTNTAGTDTYSLPITVSAADASVTVSGFTLTANAAGATYQWLDCDNAYAPIAGETGSSFSPNTDGSYAVSVTQNGCVDTSACNSILGLKLDESDLSKAIAVYPNPSTGMITIDAFATNWQGGTICLSDAGGNVLLKTPIGQAKTMLNLSEFAKGIYFISVETQGGTVTQKITLQ